jgi:uncharacterized protein
MDIEDLIEAISTDVKALFEGEGTGHDFWHIHRVMHNSIYIAEQEGADVEIAQITALLHDVGDHKFHNEKDAPDKMITKILKKYKVSNDFIEEILLNVKEVSYKGADVVTNATSIEAKCVQDADRLDAIGAIGIARAFAFGGNRNRIIYDPNVQPTLHTDFETYKSDKGHTINHFYEKLLLLKDRMQTETGRAMAEDRHQFIESFLEQFYREWDVE